VGVAAEVRGHRYSRSTAVVGAEQFAERLRSRNIAAPRRRLPEPVVGWTASLELRDGTQWARIRRDVRSNPFVQRASRGGYARRGFCDTKH